MHVGAAAVGTATLVSGVEIVEKTAAQETQGTE